MATTNVRGQLAPLSDDRFKEAFFLIEANPFARHQLWKEWHKRVVWEKESDGYAGQIGTIDGRPVNLAVMWVRINHKLIGFWEMISPLADYEMAEKWLSQNCNAPRTNPDNFQVCVHATLVKPL